MQELLCSKQHCGKKALKIRGKRLYAPMKTLLGDRKWKHLMLCITGKIVVRYYRGKVTSCALRVFVISTYSYLSPLGGLNIRYGGYAKCVMRNFTLFGG